MLKEPSGLLVKLQVGNTWSCAQQPEQAEKTAFCVLLEQNATNYLCDFCPILPVILVF